MSKICQGNVWSWCCLEKLFIDTLTVILRKKSEIVGENFFPALEMQFRLFYWNMRKYMCKYKYSLTKVEAFCIVFLLNGTNCRFANYTYGQCGHCTSILVQLYAKGSRLSTQSNDHGFHGNKATIFCLTSKYYSLHALSEKLYFLEIGAVHLKLWSCKCMMLKTLNSIFIDWEDTSSYCCRNSAVCIGDQLLDFSVPELVRSQSAFSTDPEVLQNSTTFTLCSYPATVMR